MWPVITHLFIVLVLHEQVMKNLRAKVAELGEEELFEGILRRSCQMAPEQRPSSRTIDGIMQSLISSPEQKGAQASIPYSISENRIRDGEDAIMLDNVLSRT